MQSLMDKSYLKGFSSDIKCWRNAEEDFFVGKEGNDYFYAAGTVNSLFSFLHQHELCKTIRGRVTRRQEAKRAEATKLQFSFV